MQGDVDFLFGPGGPFAALDTYEYRPAQVQYAKMVEHAFGPDNTEGYPLLAEGPTGVGKSLGYGVPGIANILMRPWREDSDPHDDDRRFRRHLLIVTGNIALQEQLVEKDLPFIAKTTGWQFRWALLKGRANYACNRNMNDLDLSKKELFEDELQAELVRLKAWFERTRKGDKSEVDPSPSGLAWSMATSSSDDCTGKKCAWYEECFYYQQRRRAREVPVIVTNYHFLLTEILLRMETGAPSVLLPEIDLIVCDEAHDLGEIARRYFAAELRTSQLRNLGRLLKGPKLKLQAEADTAFQMARDFADWARTQLEAYQGDPCYNPARFLSQREAMIYGLTEIKDAVMAKVNQYRRDNDIQGVSEADLDEMHRKHLDAMRRPATTAAKYLDLVDSIFPEADKVQDDIVYFVEESGDGDRKNYSFVACPYAAGELLKNALWDNCERVVLTSATLASDLGAAEGASKFQFAREELGLHEAPCLELVVPSPFDTATQMAVFIETGTDPTQRSSDELAQRVADLIQAAGGGALCLFTSYAAMRRTHRELAAWLREYGVTPLLQGERSRLQLTEQFRRDRDSCLFATRSFFQGVDVQGSSCRMVILDKLPFPGMNDPFITHQKRSGIGGKWGWFMGQSVPRALMAFRQSIGRLIRTTDDYGVVAVLDSRMAAAGGKSYGAKFRRAIPSEQYLSTPQDVAAFFAQRDGAERGATVPERAADAFDEADDIPF